MSESKGVLEYIPNKKHVFLTILNRKVVPDSTNMRIRYGKHLMYVKENRGGSLFITEASTGMSPFTVSEIEKLKNKSIQSIIKAMDKKMAKDGRALTQVIKDSTNTKLVCNIKAEYFSRDIFHSIF